MYEYKLIYEGKEILGAFIYDNDFGAYFITSLTNKCEFPKNLNLVCNDDEINIIYSNPKYLVHEIRRGDLYVYLFAKLDSKLDNGINYLTLDNLGFKSQFELFTGGDVLEYLASLCILPNGNYVVGSVQDYITIIEKIKNNYKDKETFFRGHYNYKYMLIPSLYRKKKFYDNESYMYMDFKTQFYKELSNKKYIEILTTMQHYSMPTRLLDTTSNPLVALYMACDKPKSYKNPLYGIGEVVIMNEDRKNVKYSDSNAVTLLSCLAVLETNYKQELYEKITESIEKNDSSIYKNCMAYHRFIAEVYNELPYFDEMFFTPEVLLYPRHVRVGMINERIIAQSGNFIIFGLCNYLTGEYKKLDTVSKERVFIVHRDYISKQLEMLNINDATMYPDKDHNSRTITKSYDK